MIDLRLNTRIALAAACLAGLLLVYLLQRFDLGRAIGLVNPATILVFNKSVRFLLNDFFAIGLLYTLFPEKKYVQFAILVQLFGTLFFLTPYLIMRLFFAHYTGAWINFLHRIILNPILLFLLIPAFYYQKRIGK